MIIYIWSFSLLIKLVTVGCDTKEPFLRAFLEKEKFPTDILADAFAARGNTKEWARRLSELPSEDSSTSDNWLKILGADRSGNISMSNWRRFQPIVPYIPPEVLLHVNFTTEMIRYFGLFQLEEKQQAVLAEIVATQWGEHFYDNVSQIMRMGSIFCGLSRTELSKISTSTLRELLQANFFVNLRGCSDDKLAILSTKAQSYSILGPPRTWTPENIESVGVLLGGLGVQRIREIRSECFPNVTPQQLMAMSSEKLKTFRLQQLLMLSMPSMLTWRRKTLDFTPLYSAAVCRKPILNVLYCCLVISLGRHITLNLIDLHRLREASTISANRIDPVKLLVDGMKFLIRDIPSLAYEVYGGQYNRN